ncbi:MAG TPA: S53 family peptidase [Pirellulales bacterium]|nr:S53 family peptidase [Pirellulales bacterium]
MSADPLTVDVGANAQIAAAAAEVAHTQVTDLASGYTAPIGYTPAQIAAAYGFNQIKFGNVVGNGAGQTIAIVDAYNDPNIANDLAAFDKQFGLAAPKFTEVKQTLNGQGPMNSAGWSLEISLDVEWAHAMAPAANIELVEAYSPTLNNLLTCVQYAAAQPGVSVVSMSWGASEFSSEANYNSYFTTPAGHTGVSFVASSGDSGAGALWPAISTNVLSVGGTSLTLGKNNTYGSETAWSGSGGGESEYQSEASYEKGVQTTGKQMDPDVAYDANPNTGFAVYDTEGYGGWLEVGGTSAGAPQWSALVAIANQGRVLDHENTLTNAAAAVFAIPSNDFHDVTTGNDGGHSAAKGYDEVTGLGTPQANLVAQGLLGVTAAQQTYTSVAASVKSAASVSVSSKVDVWAFDESSMLDVGVAFSQTQASSAASMAGPAVSLVGGSSGAYASGTLAVPQGSGSTSAAASVFHSSTGSLATAMDHGDSFDGTAHVGAAAWNLGLTAETGGQHSPVAGGMAACMSEESLARVDATFAVDAVWGSAQAIAGQGAGRASLSLGDIAAQETGADDAEAEQLAAVLMAVGAVLTTLRSGDAGANQPEKESAAHVELVG